MRKRKRRTRVVVSKLRFEGGFYQRELIKCGKPKCRRCRHRPAHGPYWYRYERRGGRLVSTYIGKRSPLEPDPGEA
jgi:hypothetical protein